MEKSLAPDAGFSIEGVNVPCRTAQPRLCQALKLLRQHYQLLQPLTLSTLPPSSPYQDKPNAPSPLPQPPLAEGQTN